MSNSMARALRAAGWACAVLIAILSLVPADSMSRTGLSGQIEHAMAYAGTAFLLALGHRGQGALRVAVALAAYAGLLELLQHFSPGRHPGLDGWAASSAGAVAGAWTAHLVRLTIRLERKEAG